MASDNSFVSKINEIGQCEFPPKLSVSDLTIGKQYKIKLIKKVKTCFGECVLCEVEDGVIFLPKRLTSTLTPECIEELLCGNGSYLTYEGVKPCGQLNPAHKFTFKKL